MVEIESWFFRLSISTIQYYYIRCNTLLDLNPLKNKNKNKNLNLSVYLATRRV